MSVLPVPLIGHDRDDGYLWELPLGANRELDAVVLKA